VSYLTLVLIAVILGLLLDIRKMILNVDFKEK
jgi:hypothetical protein